MILFLTEEATQQQGLVGGGGSMILMLVFMVLIFVLFVILPENKRKKKTQEMLGSLSVGDEISTIGGMLGKVVQVTDETVTFETGEDRVRIQVKKSAIAGTKKMEEAEAKK